jgi:hypothetical protein
MPLHADAHASIATVWAASGARAAQSLALQLDATEACQLVDLRWRIHQWADGSNSRAVLHNFFLVLAIITFRARSVVYRRYAQRETSSHPPGHANDCSIAQLSLQVLGTAVALRMHSAR